MALSSVRCLTGSCVGWRLNHHGKTLRSRRGKVERAQVAMTMEGASGANKTPASSPMPMGELASLIAPPSHEKSVTALLNPNTSSTEPEWKRSPYLRNVAAAGAFLLSAVLCLVVFNSDSAGVTATIIPFQLSGSLRNWKQSWLAKNGTTPEGNAGDGWDSQACPAWYSSLRADFKPWHEKRGITIEDVQAAQPIAASRFQILNGTLYMESFHHCFQTRLRYSLWGLLMLLRKYPGAIPDVDFMWDCGDDPKAFRSVDPGDPVPFLFNYCKLAHSLDVPFPDWSFWGWPELDILPWRNQSARIVQGGADARAWSQRKPTAFWKGNVWVGYGLTQNLRLELTDCSKDPVWEVDAFGQDWGAEVANGFQYSRQWQQCGWRYKVYAEGNAWSVSAKYGFACGSTMLVIEPYFEAFYSRGMAYGHNCLFVRRRPLCEALKEQVDWGNQHEAEAAAIAQAGQRWVLQDLSMEHVYEYMLHLLKEYAALQPSERTLCKRHGYGSSVFHHTLVRRPSMQTFTPTKSPGSRLVREADVLAEAAPHEVADYLVEEPPAARPLCRLVESKVDTSVEGGRKLLEVKVTAGHAGSIGVKPQVGDAFLELDGGAGSSKVGLAAHSGVRHMLESHWSSWLRTLQSVVARLFSLQAVSI